MACRFSIRFGFVRLITIIITYVIVCLSNTVFRLGDYSTIFTEPEVNNCFNIYTRSDLNRIRKEIMKTTTSLIHGWIHAWTCSRKQQMNNSWIFTVFPNMANPSFNFFVSFSINDWKENVESLNNFSFWEETQSYIFFCQLTVNETVFCRFLQMLSTAATIEVSDVYLQCSVPCHVNSLARTVFENICVPFFLHKLTSIQAKLIVLGNPKFTKQWQ